MRNFERAKYLSERLNNGNYTAMSEAVRFLMDRVLAETIFEDAHADAVLAGVFKKPPTTIDLRPPTAHQEPQPETLYCLVNKAIDTAKALNYAITVARPCQEEMRKLLALLEGMKDVLKQFEKSAAILGGFQNG